MGRITYKASFIGVMIGLFAAIVSTPASAHITVKPAEVVTAGYQTFTVNVPNEREVPTVSVKVLVPQGVQSVTPTQKAGWAISIEEKDETVTSIEWSSGQIADGTRDEFSFSAKAPDTETELQWKAYQTYADGVVVAWDQKSDDGHGDTSNNSGPFSVTKVVTETASDKEIKEAKVMALSAQASNRMAFYAAITAVLLGLISIYLATRREK